MFIVTEAEAAAIRAAFEQRGELSAAVELRRLFPAITEPAPVPELLPAGSRYPCRCARGSRGIPVEAEPFCRLHVISLGIWWKDSK
jgi:hypothetical protein